MEENLDLSRNAEIEDALKEFENKNQTEQTVNPVPVSPGAHSPEVSKMSSLVIKLSGGLIKDERQAGYVLLIIVFLSVSVSLFLFLSDNKKPDTTIVPPGYTIKRLPDGPPKLEKL